MTEVYLIEFEVGEGYRKETEVFTSKQKGTALSFLGDVATGKKRDVKVENIYRANLTRGTMIKQRLQLNEATFKLDLVDGKPPIPAPPTGTMRPDGPDDL